jgi:hypothetical protein
MLIYAKARSVHNAKRAFLSIPMVYSAAIIAAAAVILPSHVVAAVHAPPSAATKAIAECTHEAWPYYSSACLRRDNGAIRSVRVIPIDHVVKN